MDQILVWDDKHGSSYYDASTPEKLEAAAISILKTLVEVGYIYEPEDPMEHIQYSGIDLEQAELTDEQIATLPTASLRDEAEKHKKRLARRVAETQSAQSEYNLIQKLVAGETVLGLWRKRDRYDDEEWQKIVEKFGDKPGTTYDDAGNMLRPRSAWRVLEGRSGYEYENYHLETLS